MCTIYSLYHFLKSLKNLNVSQQIESMFINVFGIIQSENAKPLNRKCGTQAACLSVLYRLYGPKEAYAAGNVRVIVLRTFDSDSEP